MITNRNEFTHILGKRVHPLAYLVPEEYTWPPGVHDAIRFSVWLSDATFLIGF